MPEPTALLSLLVAGLVVDILEFLGVPVSFDGIIVSTIVGSGAAVTGSAGVNRTKRLWTVGS